MKIEVKKIAETPDSTMSSMFLNDKFFCFVIEDGHRETKEPGKTRIPAGEYKIIPRKHGGFFARYRQKFGHAFAIQIADVPGFQDILIHTGNTKEDTRGCLLVADQAGKSGTDYAAPPGSSTPAYLRLYNEVERAFNSREETTIKVER